MGSNIILVGLRGSGKTTIGKLLALHLQCNFIDTDQYIEQHHKSSIPQIIDQHGWEFFRDSETETLRRIVTTQESPYVLSTGGGIILRPENRELLSSIGTIIWLDAPDEILSQRINGDPNRPSLTAATNGLEEVKIVRSKREDLYKNLAHKTILTESKDATRAVEAIINFIQRK